MTLQEIQYKAQGIIHKWRDDDSAPYIEFVEELAHMIVPEPSEDLEEAADNHIREVADAVKRRGWELETQDITNAFIAGAKWQKEQMMRNVLHGWLDEDNEPPYDLNVVCEEKIPFGKFKHGDKVHIIIVKED